MFTTLMVFGFSCVMELYDLCGEPFKQFEQQGMPLGRERLATVMATEKWFYWVDGIRCDGPLARMF